ncbi:AAA family ATPase [Luteitalea sp.]
MAERVTPQKVLVHWANQQDAWVRSVVAEVLSSRQSLGEESMNSAFDLFLREKELTTGEQPSIPLLRAASGEVEGVEPLRFVRLGDVEGVNALCTGAVIDFSPRLTVLFGENAAGKSGYVRIIKRLAAVRSAETVLPNVNAGAASTPVQATVTYTLSDVEAAYHWKGDSGVSPFTRVSVFDTRATTFHVDEDLAYSYTPRDLSLFRFVHAAVESVREKLEQAKRSVQPSGNPFISLFARGTRVYPKIEALGAHTDLQELRSLSLVPAEEAAELESLRSSVDALRSEASKARVETAKVDRDVYASVAAAAQCVRAMDWFAYSARVEEVHTATEFHLNATQNAFANGAVPAVLSREWTAFIQAAEAYIRTSAPEPYPTAGAACVYCRQPLADAAVGLVQKYRRFTNSQAKQALEQAVIARDAVTVGLRALDLTLLEAQVQQRMDAIEPGAIPTILSDAMSFVAMAKTVQASATAGERLLPPLLDDCGAAARELETLARAGHGLAEQLVTSLGAEADERQKALKDQAAALADLEARLKLAEQLGQIEKHVSKLKWVAKATTMAGTFQGLLKGLTSTSKIASEELVNQDFERLFKEECIQLRAPAVILDFPGREGQAKRRKMIVKDHALSEILSEGEQKAIALADFLAEAGLPNLVAPIVFDDPVNSLDYKRLRYVVDRIAALSATRQVVVFTHNIWFTAELLARFEKAPAEQCKYYEVSSEGGVIGSVEPLPHGPKWDTPKEIGKKIEERIRIADKLSGVAREDLIRAAYSSIRGWCETFVEQEVLAGVSARYRPHVRMTVLPQIKGDRIDAATSVVLPIFESACRITDAHSQPLETLNIKPTLDELKRDYAALDAARKAYLAN